MKAYMSDPTDSEELRFCLRKGKDAGAELAKILAETEPAGDGYHESSAWMALSGSTCELAESLAAFVADDGPLDQLAWDAERAYLADLSAFGTPGHPVTCQRRCCATMAHRNAQVGA